MDWTQRPYSAYAALMLLALQFAGCGATRSTDTNRTATEQLLVSDAIDRAVQNMDLHVLAGQTVYLDDTKLADVVDKNYLISSLHQYLLANGCQLRDKREEADFVVEARAGAVGTDRNDLLFGVPSMNVPQIPLVQPVPAAIPEIPIAKRKDQRGVAKIAVFAYHRKTGAPVWQSGLVHEESSANDVWILGAGPFQRGTIYDGTEFAGGAIRKEDTKAKTAVHRLPAAELARASTFKSPQQFAKDTPPAVADQKVVQASHQEAPKSAPAAVAPPSPAPAPPAAAPTAAAPPKPPETPQTASKPPAPVATPKPTGLSATADPGQSPISKSAYLQSPDMTTLPQPRFNSPQ